MSASTFTSSGSSPDSSAQVRSTLNNRLHRPLHALFNPRSVAVIGASERVGSVGRTVFTNLRHPQFAGRIYPVNAQRSQVLGVNAYPDIASIPEPVDLAVIMTPAPTVPGLIEQCGLLGVPAAIVISAGFKELGPTGLALEQQMLGLARQYRIRIIGPNCLGVMNPCQGLNATFANTIARPGSVALLSQSGAICTGILDWSLQTNVGFTSVVSLGSMLDIGWADLIDYFGQDTATSAILLYMETIGPAREFLSAARDVALKKPIICIKGGRTREASAAAVSHTGSLAGNDEAFDAALRRVGVLRVERIAELFSMADLLAKQPRPRGRRLTIVTNAGGPGVLATDALVQGGGQLAPMSEQTMQLLNESLPVHWSHANPIDVLGDADPERYAKTLQAAANDPNSDGLLVVLTPQEMTDPLKTAEALRPLAHIKDKPVIASWMGGASVAGAVRVLNEAAIPNFAYPDTAARAFNYLWQYAANLSHLYETPTLLVDSSASTTTRRSTATALLERVRAQGRTLLTELESKQLLAAYEIPTVATHLAGTAEQAVELAEQIGFPVVVKLNSETITHKTDVSGVRLNLTTREQVADAFHKIQSAVTSRFSAEQFQGVTVQPMVQAEGYELILGSTLDEQLGPVVMFGTGGQLVEVFQDSAIALPPLNGTLARHLIEQTRICRALRGVRGRPPVDLLQLERTLIGFGNMLIEQPCIRECDINPLLASPDGVLALDARVVLHAAEANLASLPIPAIRPYPAEYIREVKLKTEAFVTLRPIQLEDEPMMVRFHESLSDESVRRRYFQMMHLQRRTEHERLIRVCYCDYDREIVLVAEHRDSDQRERRIVGVGRLSREWRGDVAQFAITISDAWHRHGLGSQLFLQLIEVARREQVSRIVGHIMPDNLAMQNVCRRLGFQLTRPTLDDDVFAALDL